MARVLVAIAEEDGTLLERFYVDRPLTGDTEADRVKLAADVRDHIEYYGLLGDTLHWILLSKR